jgi:peroxiredoxin
MIRIFTAFILILATFTTQAQQVADFSLTNVITGSKVSLDTYPSCSGIVIVFTSNACAYDEYYRSRIDALSKEFNDKVPVLLVNSSVDPIESTDNMIRKAQQLSLTVPYLADKDQTLMQRLGATKTPQAFLLKNNAGKFSLVYSGALDDNAQVRADVRHNYLKDAIEIMLTNQKIETSSVRPVGCSIRKK